MTENSQKARETTPEENFRELYKRFAQLNDKVSALLAPAWGSEMGLIPSDHPLYQGEKPVQEQEQGAPVDWRAVVERRERELKTVGEARHAAEQRAARAEADLKTLGQTALGYQQRAWDAEAALGRVRTYATHLYENGNTRHAQDGLHVLALIADKPEHTLIDGLGRLLAAPACTEPPAPAATGPDLVACPSCLGAPDIPRADLDAHNALHHPHHQQEQP
ncbi:hypothetical protein AB0N20_27425 [Streptomyces griseoincarnatus]